VSNLRPEDYPAHFPWELVPPAHYATGFTICGGTLTLTFSYAIYPKAVLLMVASKVGDQATTIWRRIWAPKEEAVESATQLVGDAEEYLIDTLGLMVRPVEDLDLGDYLEHLKLNLANKLN
jgi:hypothetical protein